MSKRDQDQHRGRYTLEFKLEAVRLVSAGQDAFVTARFLNMPRLAMSSWVRLAAKGGLQGAGERPVSAEQMELGRLQAELARVKRERDIQKNATAYFARESLCSAPGSASTGQCGQSSSRA